MTELLKVANPDLLKEWDYERNPGVLVEAIRVNASNRVWWKCRVDPRHRWEARVRNRAIDGNGCPYCSGRKTLKDDSFAARFPEIASQLHATKNPSFDPFAVSPGSNKLVWWICPNGHEWRSAIARRVTSKSGCRKCAYAKGRPTLAQSPLAREFHPTKNGKQTVESVTLGSRARLWWRCVVDPSHEWQEAVNYRVKTGKGCPRCHPRVTGPLKTLDGFSELLCREWHPILNGKLAPKNITVGSSKKVWWQCSKNPSHTPWQAVVRNRTINKQGCPKCAARAFDERRSIARMFPGLAAEWHPTKNGNLTPDNVTVGSSRKVWWRCAKDPGHEWERIVKEASR